MKNMTIIPLITLAVCVFICGCVYEPRRARYGDPNEIVAGTPDSPTMYDLGSSVDSLIQKMLGSPQFSKNYNAAKDAKGGALPIVIIGNIANRTTERI